MLESSSLTFTAESVVGDGVARVAGTEVRAGSVGADLLTEVQGLTTLVDLCREKIYTIKHSVSWAV